MAFVLDWSERYMKWQNQISDSRLEGYPLLSTPLPLALLIGSYLLAVKIGPRIMQNRQAWDLKTYNTAYNIAQLIFCACYVAITYMKTELPKPDGLYLNCKVLDKTDSKKARELAFLMYINFIARCIELSETFVHILRKKSRQLSVLHVSHHTFNVLMSWGLCRFYPGATGNTLCMVNFLVHFIMFAYYLAASSSNSLISKISRVFKKYLTLIQMVQFLYMVNLMLQDLGLYPPCKTNCFMTWFCLFCIIWDFILFAHFYRVNYLSNKKRI